MRSINTETSWWGRIPGSAEPTAMTVMALRGQVRRSPDSVATMGLRFGSPQVADALALEASYGAQDAEGVLALLQTGREHPRLNGRWQPAALAALALFWAGRSRTTQELAASAEIYCQWGTRRLPWAELSATHHQIAAQAMLLAGRIPNAVIALPELTKLPPQVRQYIDIDLLNPTHTGAADWTEWLESLSEPFTSVGLAAIAVDPLADTRHMYDRLSAPDVQSGTVDGPLVTVVIPCYRPDEGLLTSIRSMAAQTYQNQEIVIVDDCSGPGFAPMIERAAALDSRVRVITMDRNGGSYLARRTAMAQTTGHYITTQDADDWSHPQRLEKQVDACRKHPEASASRSLAVRAKDDLTHQWLGYRAIRDNASSLLFRREALNQVGTFLPIRKGADSEYAERLTHFAGPIIDTGTPLAITRLRMGSLSRGDFTYGWANPDRNAFRGAYRGWHRAMQTKEKAPNEHTAQRLDFDVPSSFVRALPGHESQLVLDHVYLGDFRHSVEQMSRGSESGILGLELDGSTLGLWHQERFGLAKSKRADMHATWWDYLQSHPRTHPITRLSKAHIGRLTVTDARVLLLVGDAPATVTADTIDIWLTPEVVSPITGLPVDLLAAADQCFAWFGRRPDWTFDPALSEAERAAVRTALPTLAIHSVSG